MSNNNLLTNLIIRKDYFNTKFLYYNYYQFKKTKNIVINYRTPYCILDGIYFECNNVYIKSVVKHKGSKSFMLNIVIPSNHNIINLLEDINTFNTNFFENLKLEINNKKRKTLKSSSYCKDTRATRYNLQNNNSTNMNYNNLLNTIEKNNMYNDIYYNDDNKDNDYNDYNDNNDNNDIFIENISNKPKESKNRFDNIQNLSSVNKIYYYSNFLLTYNDMHLITCEIKPEFCQKLFYKLRTDLSISKDPKNKEYINICNSVIKSCNQEFFEFKQFSSVWSCENWNIGIDCNIKCNNFTADDNTCNLNMLWKICSYSS